MPRQLSADCLNEIFEYLENYKADLYSCLLVNRLWCKISVRILWRNIWKFVYLDVNIQNSSEKSTILNTLVACLPNESKKLLHRNGINIPTPTSKPPLFNYATFCKVLSIHKIYQIIYENLGNEPITSSNRNYLVISEVIKMFLNQITSLKKLTYEEDIFDCIPNNITFTYFSEAKNCLTGLSKLKCSSNIPSDFFYQLSQICRKLQSINIIVENETSNELKELISLQENLKDLRLSASMRGDWTGIITALKKHSNTLTKLHLSGINNHLPYSFVTLFPNLQEIKLSFYETGFKDFDKLRYVTFSKLQILNISYPFHKYFLKLLENNEIFYGGEKNMALNLLIIKLCPNLKKLSTIFNNEEINTLRIIFDNCQYLESMKFYCGKKYFLSEKKVLEIVVKHSPKNFYELKIYNVSNSELLPEDLESFFISWKNRVSKKALSLIIIKHKNINSLEVNEENMKIIEKYINLGIIKKFKVREKY